METNQITVTTNNKSTVIDLATVVLKPEIALKCLYGEFDVIVPNKNAKACNNLEEYMAKSTLGSQKKVVKVNFGLADAESLNGTPPDLLRKPFAAPLTKSKVKENKSGVSFEIFDETSSLSISSDDFNLIHRLRKKRGSIFDGPSEQMTNPKTPMQLLTERLGQTVKILTKRQEQGSGVSKVQEYEGKLILFDKDMNLFLNDVIETYTRKIDDKVHKRSRHREKILLRGNNIIHIS